MVLFAWAIINAIIVNTHICPVNAFVDATPISGPTCKYTPASVSLAMVLPTTLTKPRVSTFCRFASRTAASVSAVSPLCDMTITTSSSKRIGSRYLNSLAYSTSTGVRHKVSKRYSPTRALCHEVPHAQMTKRLALTSLSMTFTSPPKRMKFLLASMRPRMQFSRTCGCSITSLSMKCLYPCFSMAAMFISTVCCGSCLGLCCSSVESPSLAANASKAWNMLAL